MDDLSVTSEKIEIINGNIYFDKSYYHDFQHSDINSNIFALICSQITEPGCNAYLGNMALYSDLDNAKHNGEHAIPDIVIVSDRKCNYNFSYYGVPVFVAETISPATAQIDRSIKMDYYASKGIEEYWIVDYRAKSIEVYYLQGKKYKCMDVFILVDDIEDDYNADTLIKLKELPSISIKLADIFKNISDENG